MTRPLRVLMYHRILDPAAEPACYPSVVSATPRAFRDQMRYVARHYRVLPVDDVLDLLATGRALPPRALLVTFDDGCQNFGEVAWPILREFRLPATVFVPTAFPGHPERPFWWDRLPRAIGLTRRSHLDGPWGRLDLGTAERRRSTAGAVQRFLKAMPHEAAMQLVDDLCGVLGEPDAAPGSAVLSWDDIRSLAADGVVIGPHTRTHPALTQLPPDEARREIRLSAEDLQRELGGRKPRVFAYPFGDHDERIVTLVQEEGFEMAFTCRDGHSSFPGSDNHRVRRTGITTRTTQPVFRVRLTIPGGYLDRWRHRRQAAAPPASVVASWAASCARKA